MLQNSSLFIYLYITNTASPLYYKYVTPISFLKIVILYRLQGEGLLGTLLHLIYFFYIVTWKQRLIV